ncbi:MAG: DUF134 domain-containing protein [Spirochaetia bacterium]
MPRPVKPRWVNFQHQMLYFSPTPVPVQTAVYDELTIDELEALRLADIQGLSQEEAAERMNVSRATFGRIVAKARGKAAAALVYGRGLHIQGGNVEFPGKGRAGHGGRCHRKQRRGRW